MPLKASSIYPSDDPQLFGFPSRRSVVHSTKAIVSTVSPLASIAGLRVIRQGGNAADAAVAAAAVLNLVDPAMTGIGGDMFCLFYEAKSKKVHALNGSGRAPEKATLEQICNDLGVTEETAMSAKIPGSSVHSVTIPGAAAGWVDTVERFGSGKVSMQQVLAPAIELAEEGFPVSEVAAYHWCACEDEIKKASPNGSELLKRDPKAPDGYRAPRAGEIFKSPNLAKTFRLLAEKGKPGFYEGPVAEAIVKVTQDLGGHHTLEDLKHHAEIGSQSVDPISIQLNGHGLPEHHAKHTHEGKPNAVEIWEHPPNGQGIVALMALGILEELENSRKIPKLTHKDHNTAKYLHALIEALKISFADAASHVTDPHHMKHKPKELISHKYLADRAKLFNPDKAANNIEAGSPALISSDTVYLAVTDAEGNGCSFINSVYDRFGSAIVPAGTGFALQNRGANFRLHKDHTNAFAPRKRPYHTIIPAMITNAHDQSLHTVYGVMGGFMQPQGHVQVLLNMLTFNMNPQAALDAPRICIGPGMPSKLSKVVENVVSLEEGISEEVVKELEQMGHHVQIVKGHGRSLFGRGQVIRVHHDEVEGTRVYSAGSDPRGDGASMPL